MSDKKSKCGAAKRGKAAKTPKGEPTPTENERNKKARSVYFTTAETDLLLSLLMQSDILSQATNKVTPYGRLKSWGDLHRVYNASPNVNVCFCPISSLSLCLSLALM